MHYTELLKGVNAYASDNQNQAGTFPRKLYPEEAFYFEVLDNTKPLTMRAITFLKKWNRRVKINNDKLQTVCQKVPTVVLNWSLQYLPLWDHKSQIIEIFCEFIPAVKYTGTSKALHILNPGFFMMWDDKIRYGYGCSENEEGYFNFLIRTQKEIQEVIQTYTKDYPINGEISQLIYSGRVKSIVKLLDEYNFAKYTKGWI